MINLRETVDCSFKFYHLGFYKNVEAKTRLLHDSYVHADGDRNKM